MLTQDEQKYYETYYDMFGTEGWKVLMDEVKD